MKRKLNLSLIEEAAEAEIARRKEARKPDDKEDIVQTTIRLTAGEYGKFRAICEHQRRTNGEMLVVLMEFYLANQREED